MDSSDTRATLLLPQDDRLQSLRKRNKTIIIIFFSLIILLALILTGIIISLLPKYTSPIRFNPAIREYCSSTNSYFFCESTLSSLIRTTSQTNPNQVFLLSLQASLKHLSEIASNLTRPEPDLNCSSSLARATGLIRDVLAIVQVNPNVETRSNEQRDEMVGWMDAAAEALASCVIDLEKVRPTAAVKGVRQKVIEVDGIVRYSREFVVNCDSVNENFRWALAAEGNARNQIVEDLLAATLFGSQYFVLVLLFCLLVRFYKFF